MKRDVNQSNPTARPVYDTERYRSADAGVRPVGSHPWTVVPAHYDEPPPFPVVVPPPTGADRLAAAKARPVKVVSS